VHSPGTRSTSAPSFCFCTDCRPYTMSGHVTLKLGNEFAGLEGPSVMWAIEIQDIYEGSAVVSVGQILGVCNKCVHFVTVRLSECHSWSRDRKYSQCPTYQCGNFEFWSAPTHVPPGWPKCDCGEYAIYRKENGCHVLKCWKEPGHHHLGHGCVFRSEPRCPPELDHRLCVVSGCNLGNSAGSSLSQTTSLSMPIFRSSSRLPHGTVIVRLSGSLAVSLFESATAYTIFALALAEFEVDEYGVLITLASASNFGFASVVNDFALCASGSSKVQLARRVDVAATTKSVDGRFARLVLPILARGAKRKL
jgi:hypothetical protein